MSNREFFVETEFEPCEIPHELGVPGINTAVFEGRMGTEVPTSYVCTTTKRRGFRATPDVRSKR
jgi:hypothetical protein